MIKQTMINTMERGKFDDLYTPEYAVVGPIIDLVHLIPSPVIWECCDPGTSEISKVLKNNGFNVISTDIKTGFDFLVDKPDFHFDVIITNPPYSLKNEFLKKCYSYGVPFALLLPITTLEGIKRGILFREYGINVIVLDRRIVFIKEKYHPWFNASWFHYGFTDEKNKLDFYRMEID